MSLPEENVVVEQKQNKNDDNLQDGQNQPKPTTTEKESTKDSNNDNTKTTQENQQSKSENPTDKNNNNNKNNNATNKKDSDHDDDDDEDDDVKLNQTKVSSYYLYKSTPKEEAEKFKPQKVTETQPVVVNDANKKQQSSWNPGNTIEEFDYSEWLHTRLKELLLTVTFKNSHITITDVDSIEGHATILFVRGKFRPGFDVQFKANFKGKIENEEVEGTIQMLDINSEEDEDDWQYDVSVKKSDSAHKKAQSVVTKDKDSVLKVIRVVTKELKDKKK